MAKRLLIVTTVYPPAGETGAQRSAILGRELRKLGWKLFVLTMPPECHFFVDYSTAEQIPDDVHVEECPCRSLWLHSQWWDRASPGLPRLAARAVRGLAKITEWILPVDEHYPWMFSAVRRGADLAERSEIDLIWATSPSLTALGLASRISVRTGIPYVADFRDVDLGVLPSELSWRARRRLRFEAKALRTAAGVTFVAPGQGAAIRKRHSFTCRLPNALVYNSFDVTELAGRSAHDFQAPTILHGGLLFGGTRRLDGLLEALKIFDHSTAGTRSAPKLVQLSDSRADREYLSRATAKLDLTEMVEIRPSLPRGEFLSACMGADILLLAVGHDSGMQMHASAVPAKLYSYFAACRPILVIGPPGCEAGKMVSELNRGFAVRDDDPDAISVAIERLLESQGPSAPLDLSLDAVVSFQASRTAATMDAFLTEILQQADSPEHRGF